MANDEIRRLEYLRPSTAARTIVEAVRDGGGKAVFVGDDGQDARHAEQFGRRLPPGFHYSIDRPDDGSCHLLVWTGEPKVVSGWEEPRRWTPRERQRVLAVYDDRFGTN